MSKTIHKVLEEGIKSLKNKSQIEADLDARLLLEAVLACNRTYLMIHKDEVVTQEQVIQYDQYIAERGMGRPLQHILKKQDFMGLAFKVTPFTLVPRRETEELVELALKLLQGDGLKMIMDIGTGTGCIPISLTVLNEKVSAIGVDLSHEALEIANFNGIVHNVSQRIQWLKSDLLENVGSQWLGKMDMIISNPPYIKSKDIEELAVEVRDFEPLMALDGGIDGLDFYRRICSQVKPFLKEGGYILFEIGYNQGSEVCELLKRNGFLQVEVKKDLSGWDRMVSAVK